MFTDEIDRVTLNEDKDWETQFIPWLENLERSNVGVEDGVFIATVDPALRVMNEDDFVLSCQVSTVSSQKIKQFAVTGLYHLGSKSISDDRFEEFKNEVRQVQSYKDDTCCTRILRQTNALNEVFRHLHEEVIDEHAEQVSRRGCSHRKNSSRVLLEEAAVSLRQEHEKYSQRIKEFTWEDRKSLPPKKCPDLECLEISDSEDSNSGSDEKEYDNYLKEENMKKNCKGQAKKRKDTPDILYGVVIPAWATELLDWHLHKSGLHLQHAQCRNLLGHKVLLPLIRWLRERDIPFKTVIQRPGDLLVLYPSAPHFGFNTGPNIAQAVNIGTKSWLPWGINAKKCTCLAKQIHVNVTSLVAAFREDLLPKLLEGKIVMTPHLLRGLRLLHDHVAKLHTENQQKHSKESEPSHDEDSGVNILTQCSKRKHTGSAECHEGASLIKCPAHKCKMTFNEFPKLANKVSMRKHVRSAHNPIIKKCKLMEKIDELFELSSSSK